MRDDRAETLTGIETFADWQRTKAAKATIGLKPLQGLKLKTLRAV